MSDRIKATPVLDAALAEVAHEAFMRAVHMPFDADQARADFQKGSGAPERPLTPEHAHFNELMGTVFRGDMDAALDRHRAQKTLPGPTTLNT